MKHFDIYRHPRRGYATVRRGFSWSALVLCYVWLIQYKMWRISALLSGFNLAVWMLDMAIPGEPHTMMQWLGTIMVWIGYAFLYVIIPGFRGPVWKAQGLMAQDYDFETECDAPSPAAAIAKARKKEMDGVMFGHGAQPSDNRPSYFRKR